MEHSTHDSDSGENKLLERLWRIVPKKIPGNRSRQLLQSISRESIKQHQKHLHELLTRERKKSVHLNTEEGFCLGKFGEMIFQNLLTQILSTQSEVQFSLWKEEKPVISGAISFTFSPTGNVVISKPDQSPSDVFPSEFDAVLIDTDGNLVLMDATISFNALNKKRSITKQRRMQRVLESVRTACTECCLVQVLLSDNCQKKEQDTLSQPHVGFWHLDGLLREVREKVDRLWPHTISKKNVG